MYAAHVRNEQDALIYLSDCLLATVSDMAMKKSRKKYEYERHIEIAQRAVDWIKEFHIPVQKGERAYDILNSDSQKVKDWAKQYEI